MSHYMRTYGASVRLRPGVSEAELTAKAVATLMRPRVRARLHWRVRQDQVASATTLDDLLAAFSLWPVRDDAGNLTSVDGPEDKWVDSTALFSALAPGLTDGSWYASTVEGDDVLITIHDAQVTEAEVDEDTLDFTAVDADAARSLPYAANASADQKITALARRLVAPLHLNDGRASTAPRW